MIDSLELTSSARICSRARGVPAWAAGSSPSTGHKPVANIPGQHPLKVLQRGPAKSPIVGVQSTIRDLQRDRRQDHRQQREHVGQALPGPLFQEPVHEAAVVHLVQQPLALPDGPPHRQLAAHEVEHPLHVHAHEGAALHDRRQRPPGVEPDLEPQVLEAQQHAVHRPLRDTDRKHAGQPAANGERLVGVQQRVNQLAHPLLGHALQGADRVLGYRIPGQKRNHMRHERRRQAIAFAQHRPDARGVARAQSEDLLHFGIGDRLAGNGRRAGRRPRPHVRHAGRPQRPEDRRARGQIGGVPQVEVERAVDEALFERADVAAAQPQRREQRGSRARHGREQQPPRGVAERHRQQRGDRRSTRGIAQAIEADVDDRLRRALVLRLDGREEDLVAGLEQRAAEHRLAGARHQGALQAGKEQAAQTASDQGQRRRAGRHAEPQPLERQRAHRRLHHERQQADAGVVDRKEAQQRVPAAERFHRRGLEHIVGDCRGQRAQEHEGRQVLQVGRLGQRAKPGAG